MLLAASNQETTVCWNRLNVELVHSSSKKKRGKEVLNIALYDFAKAEASVYLFSV